MHPERTELDWLGGQPRALKSTPSRRAAQAQLCGVQGPQAEACHSCLGGKGPFQNCRISFVEGHVQWSWACINCVFRSNSRGCSFRAFFPSHLTPQAILMDQTGPDRSLNVPSWVGDAVAQHEPYNNMLSVYRAGKEVTQLLSLPDVKNQGPAEATATADGRSQKRDDASASATHVSGRLKNGGLSFNDTWYRSPLEDPNVYQMEKNKKEFVLATYYDVAQILERVKEDHQRMKVALIDKGFLAPSDDEDEDEGMEVEESVVAQ